MVARALDASLRHPQSPYIPDEAHFWNAFTAEKRSGCSIGEAL